MVDQPGQIWALRFDYSRARRDGIPVRRHKWFYLIAKYIAWL